MAKAENLTGRRFGSLEVLERAQNRKGRVCWLCRCDCGKEKVVSAHDLKAGKCKTCGDSKHRVSTNMIDLTGKKFGRLTVKYPTERRDKKGCVYWHCLCECGRGGGQRERFFGIKRSYAWKLSKLWMSEK